MLRRVLFTALVPAAAAALVLLGSGLLADFAAEPGARMLIDVLRACAWILPLLLGLLAWRHERSRLLFAALVVAGTAWALLERGLDLDASEPLVGLGAVLTVAAAFLVIAPMEERGVLTRVGLPRLLLFGGGLAGAGLLLSRHVEWLEWALAPWGAAGQRLHGTPWTPIAIGLAAAAAGLSLVARRRDREEVGPALLFALACCLAAIISASLTVPALAVPLAATVFLLAGSLVLAQGLHALAWRHGNIDELTGLPSRRALEERLPKLSGTYSVAVLDLDHFKRVNDKHGHEAGDAVLQAVAERLRRFDQGTVFRSGGEEFVAICPGRTLDKIEPALEALREDIASRRISTPPLPGRKPRELRVTISAGAAQRSRRDPSPERVISAADAALLRAKKAGRNRVEFERRALRDKDRNRRGKAQRKP
jgi:diguanylate cyclase (GGDEF)-like protein